VDWDGGLYDGLSSPHLGQAGTGPSHSITVPHRELIQNKPSIPAYETQVR